MALLEIASLSFRIAARPLPEGVDMSVNAGAIHVLAGASVRFRMARTS